MDVLEVIRIGTPSDVVVDLLGTPDTIESLGRDADGQVVEWKYGKLLLRIAHASNSEDSAYAVQAITTVEDKDGEAR
jgi:hypothetical protein